MATTAQGPLGDHRRQDQADRLRALVRDQTRPATSTTPVTRAIAQQPREAPPAVQDLPDAPASPACVIAITSGKGGVGKTNLAVNLAARFAQAGKRTVLLDADMGLANADVLCGLQLRHNLAHVVAKRCRLEDVLADAPGGFQLAAGASGLAKMADLAPAEHLRLLAALSQLEEASDLILVDTGAGISPSVLSFTRTADRVLVVTTPEPTAVTDAYATIKVMSREHARRHLPGRPRVSVVVNQARSTAEARLVFDRLYKVAREFLDLELHDAGHVPADAEVSRSVRERMPFVIRRPRSPAAAAVTALAVRLEAGVADRLPQDTPGLSRSTGFFGRLAFTPRRAT
jgi:flagellar biosynthesis protein FlhG